MKKIFLASILSYAAGIGSVHAYYWLQAIRFDAARMRAFDDDFCDLTDDYYELETSEVEYRPDEDE